YINVYDPFHYMGEYVLRVGNSPPASQFTNKNYLVQVGRIKTNLLGKKIAWPDILAITLVLLGFIFGFSLQKSKIKFWLGIITLLIGQGILYRYTWFSGIALAQLILLQVIIICFL